MFSLIQRDSRIHISPLVLVSSNLIHRIIYLNTYCMVFPQIYCMIFLQIYCMVFPQIYCMIFPQIYCIIFLQIYCVIFLQIYCIYLFLLTLKLLHNLLVYYYIIFMQVIVYFHAGYCLLPCRLLCNFGR